MRGSVGTFVLVCALVGTGCDSGPPSEPEQPDASANAQSPDGTPAGSPPDPDNPAVIRRPFTADQIRDAWVAGLQLDLQIVRPEGTTRQRWTVLQADDDGALIEYADLDGAGQVVDRQAERSSWVELRDHASFPVALSERRAVTRPTPLGELAGWLYRVRDPAKGTVSEYFFATSLPGAPIHAITRSGDTTQFELTQLARRRPD